MIVLACSLIYEAKWVKVNTAHLSKKFAITVQAMMKNAGIRHDI
ncbi:hypothetical protein R4Z09_12320 [Niallia oryzisoli]|uniref:Uncharacterized protein n=1 Tax=Niallia oryzisoli TaxID=1737571 RepID=A0ABZ2CL31_9BACI